MTTTTQEQIQRSIEQFCGNFISLSVNFSSWGAPTIEFEMLASNTADMTGTNALNSAESILSSYFPFIIEDNFQLAHREIKQSSSGKIVSERWVDKYWWFANGTHVGLSQTVGGDVFLGSEYHSVTGVYGVSNRTIPKNYTMSDRFLRSVHRELRTGMCGYTHGMVSPYCKCSGFSSEEDLAQWKKPPGLENPEITLGEIYYTWSDFLRQTGFLSLPIKTITNNGSPSTPSAATMASLATGVFNDTGSYYNVINSIVNTFGWTYVPSCALGGHAFINPTGDFGKIDVLKNAGVEIPHNAVASSEIKDYTSGYVQGSFLSIKRPGREQDIEIPDIDPNIAFPLFCASSQDEPGDEQLTTVDVLSKVGTIGGDINAPDCVWRFISDFPIFYELGLALWIEENGTPADGDQEKWLKKIYDKVPENYKFYTQCDNILNVNPIQALADYWISPNVAFGDFNSGTLGNSIQTALSDIRLFSKVDILLRNVNRFAFTDSIDFKEISMAGDVYNGDPLEEKSAMGKYLAAAGWSTGSAETVSFSHYGTQAFDFGAKTWSASSGQVGYLDVSSDDTLGASPFADFKEFGYGSINEFLGTSIRQRGSSILDDDNAQDYGIIYTDQGPNQISTISEGGYGVDGKEIFLDQNPSLEGGLGIIGAIDVDALQNSADALVNEVSAILSENTSANTETVRVAWHGDVQELCFDSRDDYNDSSNDSDSASLNEKAQEYCDAYNADKWEITYKRRDLKHNYNQVTHPNKKLHTFNVQWSLANGEDTMYYVDENNRAQRLAYNATQSVYVPYLDKISFSLINDFYDLTGKSHLLENVSINVIDGKLTTSYTFSQKVQSPDFAGVFGGKVAFQNLIR